MTGPQIITSLRALCLQTEDKISDYQRKKAALEATAVHLRATIAYLEGRDVSRASPPSMSVAGLFQRGEAFARCLQALHEHGPELTTSELAVHCLRSKGQDTEDAGVRRAMAQTLAELLKPRLEKGEIASPGKRGVVRIWRAVE